MKFHRDFVDVEQIHTSSIAYQQMENIRSYLKAATDLGLNSLSAFDVPDLYEEKNINLVRPSTTRHDISLHRCRCTQRNR